MKLCKVKSQIIYLKLHVQHLHSGKFLLNVFKKSTVAYFIELTVRNVFLLISEIKSLYDKKNLHGFRQPLYKRCKHIIVSYHFHLKKILI